MSILYNQAISTFLELSMPICENARDELELALEEFCNLQEQLTTEIAELVEDQFYC